MADSCNNGEQIPGFGRGNSENTVKKSRFKLLLRTIFSTLAIFFIWPSVILEQILKVKSMFGILFIGIGLGTFSALSFPKFDFLILLFTVLVTGSLISIYLARMSFYLYISDKTIFILYLASLYLGLIIGYISEWIAEFVWPAWVYISEM